VELVQVEGLDPAEPVPLEPPPKPKTQNITAPKLLSKPQVSPTRRIASTSNADEQRKQVEKSEAEKSSLPETSGPGQAAGGVGLFGYRRHAYGRRDSY
jgi:hypothetical protein